MYLINARAISCNGGEDPVGVYLLLYLSVRWNFNTETLILILLNAPSFLQLAERLYYFTTPR